MLFNELALSAPILRAVQEEGYTTPTPIQIQSIRPNPQGSWADSSNLFRDAPLKVGETLQIGSVKITLLRSTPDSDVLIINQ